MDPANRFALVEQVFFDAVDLAPEERAAYLDSACQGDAALRQEVESLIAHESKGESQFFSAVSAAANSLDTAEEAPHTPTHAGPWRLVRQLGAGGMGTVWLAVRDDEEFQREVAVKFLRRNLPEDWILRRFRQERQILAGLQHPNIASFYDGGATADGSPYIVMEYVEGPPITSHCEDKALSVADRVRLFQKVCSAVAYAHRNLIVHRDLKPSNILVHRDGEPKLLDFGIAKLTDASTSEAADLTQTGVRLLTPEYGSPEQVRGEPVTTATDVYALGLILYEMLTGQRAQPVTGGSPLEIGKAVCETRPRPPSAATAAHGVAAKLLKGDLDNIVLKAIRKEPERRYESAAKLAEDLENYLAGRPVSARGDSLRYRAGKFLLRNRWQSAAAAIAVLSLIGGLTAALYQAAEARRQADRAERRFAQVRKLANTFLFDFHGRIENLAGSTPAREMVVSTALGYLDSLARDASGNAELQLELARAYEKVGDVQGLPGSPNLGKLKEAKISYERGLSIAEGLPGNEVLRSRLSLRLGMLESVAGNQAKAIELEQRAAALAEQAEKSSPSAAARREIIAANSQLGSLLLAAERPAEGTAALRRALAIEEMESAGQTSAAAFSRVGLAHARLAYALKMASDRGETLAHLTQAQTLTERAIALDPDNAKFQNQLLSIHKDRADAISSPFTPPGMDWAGALASFRAAHSIAVGLLAKDPKNQNAAVQVLLTQASIADILRETDPAAAAPAMDLAVQDWERYSHLNANNLIADRMLMNMRLAGGRIRTSLGQMQRADAEFEAALAIADRFQAKDPKRFTLIPDRLAIHTYRGLARMKSGSGGLAAADFDACRELATQLSPRGTMARHLRTAAHCFEYSGDLAVSQGRRADAQAHYLRALTNWKAITARGDRSPYLDEQTGLISNKVRSVGGAP
jgi:tetratricopeptide (TPR) repeat protein